MVIRELSLLGGKDYKVEITMHYSEGDRSRMFERNKDHTDVPLAICFNLGKDFMYRTEQEQRARVHSFIKMLRVGVNEVMQEVGKMVGANAPILNPNETGISGRGEQ